MRIIKEGSCNSNEQQVEFKATVMGTKIIACVSTDKKPVIVKNVTYFQGIHCIIQPYTKSPASELDIFNEYNRFGKEEGETTFIQHPDDNGDMKIGFGTGALLGGIDKELTFKAVDQDVFDRVSGMQKEYEAIEKIRDKHNFLFGDGDTEKMEMARHMEYELNHRLSQITGWWC